MMLTVPSGSTVYSSLGSPSLATRTFLAVGRKCNHVGQSAHLNFIEKATVCVEKHGQARIGLDDILHGDCDDAFVNRDAIGVATVGRKIDKKPLLGTLRIADIEDISSGFRPRLR